MSDRGGAGLEQQVGEVAERARRRWLIAMGVVVGVVVVAVPLVNAVVLPRHHRTATAHHAGGVTWVQIAVPVVIIALGVAFVAWVLTRRRGVFAPPLAGGLARGARRQVAATVRRGGAPSPDPLVREVETRTAERQVRQNLFGYLVFGVLCVLSLGQAVFGAHTPVATVYFSVIAVLFLGFLVRHAVFTRGARRYLAQVPRG